MADGVWLVVGVQAAGKSTVADLLAHQFERGVHVRGGQFSRWAVTGWTNPWDEDQERAGKLLDLRYGLSAFVATEYCRAGFGTVVRNNIFGEDVRTWLRAVTERPRHLVVLRPSVAASLSVIRPESACLASSRTALERQMLINSIRCLVQPRGSDCGWTHQCKRQSKQCKAFWSDGLRQSWTRTSDHDHPSLGWAGRSHLSGVRAQGWTSAFGRVCGGVNSADRSHGTPTE